MVLSAEFEFGFLSGHALIMLEQVLNEIYLPLVNSVSIHEKKSSRKDDKGSSRGGGDLDVLNDAFRNEFRISRRPFTMPMHFTHIPCRQIHKSFLRKYRTRCSKLQETCAFAFQMPTCRTLMLLPRIRTCCGSSMNAPLNGPKSLRMSSKRRSRRLRKDR